MSIKRIVLLTSTLIFSIYTIAAATECEPILHYIYDKNAEHDEVHAGETFKRLFCENDSASSEITTETGIKIGIPIDEVPVEFRSKFGDSARAEYTKRVCENINSRKVFDHAFNRAIKTVNSQVVSAWRDCLSSSGMKFWVDVKEESPYLFSLIAKYNGDVSNSASYQGLIIQPDSSMLSCKPANGLGRTAKDRQNRIIDRRENIIGCERLTEKGILLILKSDAGDKKIDLPPIAGRCSSTDEVVDTMYEQIMPAADIVPITDPRLKNVREGWINYLRREKSIKKLARKMVDSPGYRDWIVGASLSQSPLKVAYSWMANAIYFSQLRRNTQGVAGANGFPAEAEAIVATLPNQCDPMPANSCHRRFVDAVYRVIDSTEWGWVYRDNTVPLMDKDGNVNRTATYCGAISDRLSGFK